MGMTACIAKMTVGIGAIAGASTIMDGIMAGAGNLAQPPKKAVTVGHQIKHSSFMAALAGAVVGAILSTVVLAAATFLLPFTAGVGLLFLGTGVIAGFMASGYAADKTTEFIDNLSPATDGPVITGSLDVLVEGKPAARAGLDTVVCTQHSSPPIIIAQGSETVSINSAPAVRVDDKTACGAPLKQGAETVYFGSGQTTVTEIADEFSFLQKALLIGVEFLIPPGAGLIKGAGKLATKGIAALATKGAMKGITAGAKALAKSVVTNIKSLPGALKTAIAGLCALKNKAKKVASSFKERASNFIKSLKCRFGNPVDPITGSCVKHYTDFELGQTIPLVFERSYSSHSTHPGMLGKGWRDSFSDYLEIKCKESEITWYSPSGQIIVFDLPQGFQKVFNRRYPHLLLTQHHEGYTLTDTDTQLIHYFRYEKANHKAYRVGVQDYNNNHIRYYLNEHYQPHTIEHSDGITLKLHYQNKQLKKIQRVGIIGSEDLLAEYQQQSGYLTFAWSQGRTHQDIQYNAQGLMSQISYHDKSQVIYRYDEQARCIETLGSEGYHHWRFDYDTVNRVTKAYDAQKNCWQVHFDKNNQATQEIDPQGNRTQYEYDSYGLLIGETNPQGDQTRYSLDSWTGKTIAITDTLGRKTSFEYDEDFNHIEQINDINGTTFFEYDTQYNLQEITLPTGDSYKYQHDKQGNLTHIQIADDLIQQFEYDKKNRLITASDWLQQEQQYQYNQHDQLSKIITPRQHTWRYDYDAQKRLIRINNPLQEQDSLRYTPSHQPSLFTDGNHNQQHIEYGVFDLPTKQIDAEGNVTTFEYDKIHQHICKVTNASGKQWLFDYDSVGNLIKETDYNGNITYYSYTSLGQLASKKTPIGDTLRYFYDEAGRITQKHTKEGASIYHWDDQDRLIKLKTPDSTLEYQYNDKGQLSQESQNGHIIRYEYDELGNRKARHIQASPWHPESDTQSTFYQYDANGQLIQVTLPEQQPLDLEYDADGNLTQQQSPAGYINHQKIDPKGRIEQQSIGKNEKREQAAEPQYVFVNREYDYDAADNLLSCHAPSNSTHWAYNKNNQVIQQQSRNNTENYQYTSQLAVQEFTSQGRQKSQQANHYGKAGQLAQKQISENHSKHYAYDDNGRLIKKIIQRNGFRSTQQSYHWNSEDQLKKVITKNGHHWHYQYDGFGRRILKHNSNTNETTHILWDGNTIAQEITISPKHGKKDQEEQTLSITHWYFIPNSFTPLAQQTQHNTDQKHQAKGELYTTYIATDHMGTVKELFSPQGDLVWKNSNSLWGKPNGELDNPNRTPEIDCSLGFQGQYFDKETGLHYNYHRYYDADMGQYISPDPIGLLGGLHPQAYVHNPMGWVDPLGLEKLELVYQLVDKNGQVVYYGITNRTALIRANEHVASKTFYKIQVIAENLSHDEARTIEGYLIRKHLAQNSGKYDATDYIKEKLEKSGLKNENRGRNPRAHKTGWIKGKRLRELIKGIEILYEKEPTRKCGIN